MSAITLFQVGQWRTVDDAFIAHPASPTGSILDLNDGATFSILDTTGNGGGLDLGKPAPTVFKSGNPRTVGEAVRRRQYDKNRKVVVNLVAGQFTSYANFIAALHNLETLCEGITLDQPAAIKVQATGSSTPLYLDVLEAHVLDKYEELYWLQLIDVGVRIEFECRPFLRGARQWLQNLAVNPGFEAPSGPGVTVFNDAFANLNAYTVQAGSATQTDKIYYPDVVKADNPLRYYRLDEASGTVAHDASSTLQNATYTASGVTYGTTGLLTGDTDTGVTLNGTTGYITVPTSGLPSGNAPWSMDVVVKTPASFAATMEITTFGVSGATRGEPQLLIGPTGSAIAGTFSGDTTGFALSTSTIYHLAATWDGTTLTLYVNGSAVRTATPGALNVTPTYATIGATAAASPASFWNSAIKEAAYYGTCLPAARVLAHYTAATTTPATNTASLLLPAGSRVSFGNPSWGAVNTWQVVFRYVSGITASFYLYYIDASNSLRVDIANGANGCVLTQRVAGVDSTLASATVTMVSEVQYVVQFTYFPVPVGLNGTTQVVLATANGGGTLATLGPIHLNYTATVFAGAPQIATAGASLAIISNTVSLFGPGGWWYTNGTGTGTASGAWQQKSANTYPNGPVTSNGAAVITAAPAGTLDVYWATYNPASISTVVATAYPIGTGEIFQASVYVNSTGLANSCTQSLRLVEFDTNGAQLRTTTLQSVTGNQAWVKLAGTVTTGASTAYVGLQLRAVDGTNASINGVITWDNCQWWDQTVTGMATMPYCETRFPQSPAQVLVTGLLGDVTAPCWTAIGTNYTGSVGGNTGYLALGRRSVATSQSSNAQLVQYFDNVTSSLVLDSTAYAGYYAQFSRNSYNYPTNIVGNPTELRGTYQLYCRYRTTQSSGNLASISHYNQSYMASQLFNGVTTYPVIAANVWGLLATGSIAFPPYSLPGLAAAGSIQMGVYPWWVDPNYSGVTQSTNVVAFIPIDTQTILLTNSSPSTLAGGGFWGWYYVDGTGVEKGQSAIQTASAEIAQIPNPTQGVGNFSNGYILTSLMDSYMMLDPALDLGTNANQMGANQFVGYSTDSVGSVFSLCTEFIYSPLYLNLQ